MSENELIKELSRQIAEWERGDELPTEFAERLVQFLKSQGHLNLGHYEWPRLGRLAGTPTTG